MSSKKKWQRSAYFSNSSHINVKKWRYSNLEVNLFPCGCPTIQCGSGKAPPEKIERTWMSQKCILLHSAPMRRGTHESSDDATDMVIVKRRCQYSVHQGSCFLFKSRKCRTDGNTAAEPSKCCHPREVSL